MMARSSSYKCKNKQKKVTGILLHNELTKTREKVHFGGTMRCLPERLKSMFLEIFSSGAAPKGNWSEEKISKNVDFSLRGKQCFVLQKWIFPRVLAHSVILGLV